MTENHDIYYLQVKRLHKWETIRKDKALGPVTDSLGRALEDRAGSIRIVAGTRKADGGYDWATLFFKSAEVPLDSLTRIDPPPEAILGHDAAGHPESPADAETDQSAETAQDSGAVGGSEGLGDTPPPLRAERPDDQAYSKPSGTPQLTRERIFEAHPPQPLPYQPKRRKSLLPFLLALPTAALIIVVGGFVYLAQSSGPPPSWLTSVVPPELMQPMLSAGRDLLGVERPRENEPPAASGDNAREADISIGPGDVVLTAEEVSRIAANVANGNQPLSVLADRFNDRVVTLTGSLGDVTAAGGTTRATISGLFVCDNVTNAPASGTPVRVTGSYQQSFGGRIWLTGCVIDAVEN